MNETTARWGVMCVDPDGTTFVLPEPNQFDNQEDADGFVAVWNHAYPATDGYADFRVVELPAVSL